MLTVIYSLIDILIMVLLVYLFKRYVNPVRSVEATVVGKVDKYSETTKESLGMLSPEDRTTSSGYVSYWITFKLKNKKIREFPVNEDIYTEIEVKDKGILVYKGKNFLYFEKNREI